MPVVERRRVGERSGLLDCLDTANNVEAGTASPDEARMPTMHAAAATVLAHCHPGLRWRRRRQARRGAAPPSLEHCTAVSCCNAQQ